MIKRLVAILLLVLLCVGGAQAREGVLTRPEAVGELAAIDFASRTVTLDGTTYTLAKDVRWIGLPDGKSAHEMGPRLLGHRLGYRVFYPASGQAVVTQIWIMR